MADIFISYASEDRERAKLLAETLKEQGWSVWWDRELPFGRPFDEVIRTELRAAGCVIALWTLSAVKSLYVIGEAREALSLKKLISVFFTPSRAELPYDLQAIHGVELIDWHGDTSNTEFQRLVSGITAILGQPLQKITKAEMEDKVDEERKQKDAEEEIKMGKPETTDVKPPEPKPDIKVPTESRPSQPITTKARKAFKFSAIAGVIVLLVFGGWLYYKYQHEEKISSKIKLFSEQVDELGRAVVNADNQDQLKELHRQWDYLIHQAEALLEQATLREYQSWVEELRNRLKGIENLIANQDTRLKAIQRGKIFVTSTPDNPSVKIMNIGDPFQQGMELEPGKYHVEVSSEGYEPQDRWIELGSGEEKRISFELVKIIPKVARLFVETVPEDATVRILNIEPKFSQGMELEPGSYHVEVYRTERRWIDLMAGHEGPLGFELAKITVSEQTSPELSYKPADRPHFNPDEPWTGKWEVEGLYGSGTWC
jgi:hypothetical protein